jgi:putative DNA primase/helicase
MTRLADLADLPIWVPWQGEPPEKPGAQPKKVPWRAKGRAGHAAVTNPADWAARAMATARSNNLPRPCGSGGIGVVLAEIGNKEALVGIDLDTCRMDDDSIAPWAQQVIDRIASYTEVSPSETGFKVFFRMTIADRAAIVTEIRQLDGSSEDAEGRKWADGGGEHPPAIELFLGKRFFAVTERWLETTPGELRLVDVADLRWLIREAGPALAARWAAANGHDTKGPRDNSRSGAAFRTGLAMAKAGNTYDDFCAALRADPETASWFREKGEPHGGRELRRIWKKVETPAGPPWEISVGAPYDTARTLLRAMFRADGMPRRCTGSAAASTPGTGRHIRKSPTPRSGRADTRSWMNVLPRRRRRAATAGLRRRCGLRPTR